MASNAEYIVQFLRSKGASDYLIAAALGNLKVESGFDPGSYNAGEGAHGIVQWEGSRYPALVDFCNAHGLDPRSLQGQLEFMWHELTTSYHSTFEQIQNANSAYQAGLIWAQSYEGCASATWNERANNAANYLQSGFKGIGGPNDKVGGPGGAGNGGGGGNGHAYYAGVDSLGSLLQQVPELRQILQEAQANGWTIQRFQNAIENSQWYKDHSASARELLIQQANDPATYQQRLRDTEFTINQLSSQLGMNLNAQQVQAIANTALLTGNDSNQQWLTVQVGRKEDYSNLQNLDTLQGGMANTADQLQTLYASYGYHAAPHIVAHQAKQILMGNQTIDTFKQRAIAWAQSAFPALAKELGDGSTTLSQLADPYVQSMANLLEIDPSTLNVYSPKIRQALQGYTNKQGDRVVTPLWQFEDLVRQDPRWAYTQNARDTMSTALVKIGADFGFGPQG